MAYYSSQNMLHNIQHIRLARATRQDCSLVPPSHGLQPDDSLMPFPNDRAIWDRLLSLGYYGLHSPIDAHALDPECAILLPSPPTSVCPQLPGNTSLEQHRPQGVKFPATLDQQNDQEYCQLTELPSTELGPCLISELCTSEDRTPYGYASSELSTNDRNLVYGYEYRSEESISRPQQWGKPEAKRHAGLDLQDDATTTTTGGRAAAHNDCERRYRSNIQDKLDALRDSIPSLRAAEQPPMVEGEGRKPDSAEDETPVQRVSKGTILTRATDYIGYLESRNAEMQKELDSMKAAIAALMTHCAKPVFGSGSDRSSPAAALQRPLA